MIVLKILLIFIFIYISLILAKGYKNVHSPKNLTQGSGSRPRTVVSLSTLPSRVNGLRQVLESILSNTVSPDLIYLNVPEFSIRENKEYVIEDDYILNNPKIYINKTPTDYGPATKLYPTLLQETDPETLIVCIDDDTIYDKTLIENLVYYSQKYPDSVICKSGWNYINLKKFALPLYFPFLFVQKVDILQCFRGVIYKREFFDDLNLFKTIIEDKNCFTTDDISISKFLNSKKIPILMVPFKSSYKNIGGDSSLGAVNMKNNQWTKCLNYLKILK